MAGDVPGPRRLTRNWNELLQELRVTQTGVQILTGFLLIVPFSDRFQDLGSHERGVYLVILTGAVMTTGLVVAPVSFHRVLFRRGRRQWLVRAANLCALGGLGMLALTSSGVLYLVFHLILGRLPAVVVLVLALGFFLCLWAVVPLLARTVTHRGPDAPASGEGSAPAPPVRDRPR